MSARWGCGDVYAGRARGACMPQCAESQRPHGTDLWGLDRRRYDASAIEAMWSSALFACDHWRGGSGNEGPPCWPYCCGAGAACSRCNRCSGGSQERRSRTGRRTAGPRAPERRSRPAVRIRAGPPELPERCLASAVPRRAGGRSRRTAPERPGPHRTGRRRSPDRTRGRISPPLAHTRSAMRTEHENPFFLFGLSGR